MLWSKLWFFLVSLAGILALLLVSVTSRRAQHELDVQVRARLDTSDHAARQLLQLHARQWLDATARAAGDAVLQETLDNAAQKRRDVELLHQTALARLRHFQQTWHAGFVMAVDSNGRVLARAGLEEDAWRDDLLSWPLVAEALRGWRLDDTWRIGSHLYRVAATPVIVHNERYVGALLVGIEIGDELARSLKSALGLDVAFIVNGQVSGQSAALSVLGQLPGVVARHSAQLGPNDRLGVIPLTGEGAGYGVVLVPLGGANAAEQFVCVLLGQRRQVSISLNWSEVIEEVRHQGLAAAILGSALLGVLGIFFLILWLERDRPLDRLLFDIKALAQHRVVRINEKRYRGTLRVLAWAANTLAGQRSEAPDEKDEPVHDDRVIELSPMGRPSKPGESSPLRPFTPPSVPAVADKDDDHEEHTLLPLPAPGLEPVSPGMETHGLGPQFGKLDPLGPGGSDLAPLDFGMPSAPVAPPAPAFGGIGNTGGIGGSDIAAPSPLNFADIGFGAPPSAAPAAPSAPAWVPPAPTPAPPLSGGAAPHFEPPFPSVAPAAPHVAVSPPVVAPPPAYTAAPAPAAPAPARAPVPAPAAARAPAPRAPAAEDAQYEPVFQEFFNAKQICGETTDNLTLDRFAQKLRNNRADVIAKCACKDVKFDVYIKDGKAAIRATPIY